MLLYLFIALTAGFFLSNQTPINTDLRRFAGTPILAGLISFAVGTIFLALISLSTSDRLIPSWRFISEQPLWIWLGGLLGAIYLTSNILLFPRLGAIQTVILPIFGQIVMGTLIDSTGLFASPKIPLSLTRGLGIFLLTVGVAVAIVLPVLLRKKNIAEEKQTQKLLGWRLWGIVIGMMGASQQAINGHLGVALGNTAEASFISFFTGTILIFIVAAIVTKKMKGLTTLKQAKPWHFLGGILGGSFVFATVVCVPQIGAGMTIMMGLLGQMIGSMLVQQFGWWHSSKYSIQLLQVIGVVIMVGGVVMIKLL